MSRIPTRNQISREYLTFLKRLVNQIRDDDAGTPRDEPGAYAHVLDSIDRRLTELPDWRTEEHPRYGQRVSTRNGDTGRYLALGLALVKVPGAGRGMFLDPWSPEAPPPAPGLFPDNELPTDEQLAAAHTVLIHFLPGAF